MEAREAPQDGQQKSQVNLASKVQNTPKPTIEIFRGLIEQCYGDRLRLNVMTGRPEWLSERSQEWKQWTDVEDARMAAFFQSNFGMYNPRMLEKATIMYFADRKVNPLINLIESIVWDGKPRIENFLHFAVRCDDTEYTREVSRLIFAGGIHRAYRPGCKFDDMVVLVGDQGGGKSTLVRWLNMEDEYFKEIKTIMGKEGVEALRGVWIGEVSELMAMTRVKDTEAVKAFITAQEDSYRAPYNRHVEVIPRRCTFIGTTNTRQFLNDKTGNRRFYPIECVEDGYDLLSRESEIKPYIRQCWAEARELFRRDQLPPFAKRELLDAIRQAQAGAEEDDWEDGAIQQFLETNKPGPNDTTCVIELWHDALLIPLERKPDRADSIRISKIMERMPGWENTKRCARTLKYGIQKVYRKSRKDFFPF